MKIIDTFIFNDEIDLLHVRLEMLYDLIKSKKLWFSNKSLEYVDFNTNNDLLKTPKLIKLHHKLKNIN